MPSHYIDDRFVQQQKSRGFQRSKSFRLIRRPSLRGSFRKKSGRPVVQSRESPNPLSTYDDEVQEALGDSKTVEVDMCSACRKLLDGEKEKGAGNNMKSPEGLIMNSRMSLVDSERHRGHLTAMQSNGARGTGGADKSKQSVSRLSKRLVGLHSEEVFV